MLVKLGGGRAGIKAYLEAGQKAGRAYTRDELDERVPLTGHLGLADQLIRSMPGRGQRYMHITLAFREPEVSQEVLEEVVERFRTFAFAAYEEDEYLFYAEAHLPRLKAFRHARTGESVERLPHIHIVIPRVNLRSGTRLEPLGFEATNIVYVNAWKRVTNAELGLAEPEHHPRLQLQQGAAEVLSRVKGDIFSRAGELKEEILRDALEADVRDLDGLMQVAARQGEVRLGRGRDGDYVTVKPPGAQKAVRLKDRVFREAFLELELEAKLRALDPQTPEGDRPQVRAARPLSEEKEMVQHWHRQRAREVRYLSGGSRRKAYRKANESDRAAILEKYERAFRKKYPAPEPDQALPEPSFAVNVARSREVSAETRVDQPQRERSLLSPVGWYAEQGRRRLQWRSWSRELEGLYVERTAEEWQAYRFLRTVDEALQGRTRRDRTKAREREVAKRVLVELGHRHGFPQSLRLGQKGDPRLGREARSDDAEAHYQLRQMVRWLALFEAQQARPVVQAAAERAQAGLEVQPPPATPEPSLWARFRAQMNPTVGSRVDEAYRSFLRVEASREPLALVELRRGFGLPELPEGARPVRAVRFEERGQYSAVPVAGTTLEVLPDGGVLYRDGRGRGLVLDQPGQLVLLRDEPKVAEVAQALLAERGVELEVDQGDRGHRGLRKEPSFRERLRGRDARRGIEAFIEERSRAPGTVELYETVDRSWRGRGRFLGLKALPEGGEAVLLRVAPNKVVVRPVSALERPRWERIRVGAEVEVMGLGRFQEVRRGPGLGPKGPDRGGHGHGR